MEAEAAEQKKDFDPEATGAHKTPSKLSEKKRRRSHTAEGSESDVPSKIRKTSECEGGEREKDGARSSKSSLSHQCKKRKLQKDLNGTAVCHFTSSLFLIFKVKFKSFYTQTTKLVVVLTLSFPSQSRPLTGMHSRLLRRAKKTETTQQLKQKGREKRSTKRN